jgi:hypothetical protein
VFSSNASRIYRGKIDGIVASSNRLPPPRAQQAPPELGQSIHQIDVKQIRDLLLLRELADGAPDAELRHLATIHLGYQTIDQTLPALIDAHSFSLTEPWMSTLQAIGNAFALNSLDFSDGGNGFCTFASVSSALIRLWKGVPSGKDLRQRLKAIPSPMLEEHRWNELVGDDTCATQVFGRTVVIGSREGNALGIKLQKRSEQNPSSLEHPLAREWRMNELLRQLQPGLELKSTLPGRQPPWGLCHLRDVPSSIRTQIREQARSLGETGFHLASDGQQLLSSWIERWRGVQGELTLVYRHPPQYHRYLNDPTLSPKEFRQASQWCLQDSAKLARLGLYNAAPADFLHNNQDQRRFLWNADQFDPQNGQRWGTGRLDRWRQGVAFPNFRASGLADFKHYLLADEILLRHPNASWFKKTSQPAKIAHLSCMGDVLFAWTLTCADSWLRREEGYQNGLRQKIHANRNGAGRPRRHAPDRWGPSAPLLVESVERLNLEAELREGFSAYLSAYTGLSTEEATHLLRLIGINFQRMANQIQFFSCPCYVRAVEFNPQRAFSDKTTSWLFGSDVRVNSGHIQQGRGWVRNKGWSYNKKDMDWGSVNGSFPCQELIRALYLTVSLMPLLACPLTGDEISLLLFRQFDGRETFTT